MHGAGGGAYGDGALTVLEGGSGGGAGSPGACAVVAAGADEDVDGLIVDWAKAGAAINAAVRPSNTVFFMDNLLNWIDESPMQRSCVRSAPKSAPL